MGGHCPVVMIGSGIAKVQGSNSATDSITIYGSSNTILFNTMSGLHFGDVKT